MVTPRLQRLLEMVKSLRPEISKRLNRHPYLEDTRFQAWAEPFLERYERCLEQLGWSLPRACQSYLQMVDQMAFEQLQFWRTGQYRCESEKQAWDEVYSQPEVMEPYLHGLLVAQVLWPHNYELLQFFEQALEQWRPKRYLEVGAGHGAYLVRAREILGPAATLEVLEVSSSAISLASRLVDDESITFRQTDPRQTELEDTCDFVVLGEVLEHLEDPASMLSALRRLVRPGGALFLTTPLNAAAIDHISLFARPEQLESLFVQTGWDLTRQKLLPTEDLSLEQSLQQRVPVRYAALLQPAQRSPV